MQDIKDACAAVVTTAGQIGMTKEDVEKATDLLNRYGDERDRLLDEMLSLLSKSDTSDLRDDWQSRCDKGKDLLERLDHDMVPSPNGEGLRGVGAGDFAGGEKKAWEENAKADIAFVADVINKIFNADLALIAKCNDDLKTVRDGDKAVEALIEQNFGSLKTRLKDLAVLLVSKGAPALFSTWVKDRNSKDFVRAWAQFTSDLYKKSLESAKQKGAFKAVILQNIELINKTKEQLSESWIEEMYKKGEDATKSLASAGSNGDSKAVDWAKFGESCAKALAERRDSAKEQSKLVFGELLPTFLDQNNRAFAAMTTDPGLLADWRSSMQEDYQTIDEALAKGSEIIDDLADGPYKQAARETLTYMRDLTTDNRRQFDDTNKASDDELKK